MLRSWAATQATVSPMGKIVGTAYAVDSKPGELSPTMTRGARYATASIGAKRIDMPGRCPRPSQMKMTM